MHTKDILAAALRKAGLPDLAKLAEAGHYHDFLSDLDMPAAMLVAEITERIQKHPTQEMIDLRQDIMEGKHDASKEESDEWYAAQDAKSKEIFEKAVAEQQQKAKYQQEALDQKMKEEAEKVFKQQLNEAVKLMQRGSS